MAKNGTLPYYMKTTVIAYLCSLHKILKKPHQLKRDTDGWKNREIHKNDNYSTVTLQCNKKYTTGTVIRICFGEKKMTFWFFEDKYSISNRNPNRTTPRNVEFDHEFYRESERKNNLNLKII